MAVKDKGKPVKTAEVKGKPLRVRAKIKNGDGQYVGYYGVRRVREGQIFSVKSEAEIGTWMERVDAKGNPLNEDGSAREEVVLDEVETDTAGAGDEESVI